MEAVCSICGISGKMRNLFEVISPTEVALACEKCISEEGFPILKRPDQKVFEEPDKKNRVSEVMERLSGVKPREQERRELKRQEKTLREIVDKKYEEKMKTQGLSLKPRPDLVDNFHWIIMRVRRLKGLTQEQLAESISEKETTVKMAEQGIVPQGYGLIDKLERFLKIKLIKERTSSMLGQSKERNFYDPFHEKNQSHETDQIISSQSQPKKNLSFDRQSLDSLKISDLRMMKREREMENIKAMEEQDSKEKSEKALGEKEEP